MHPCAHGICESHHLTAQRVLGVPIQLRLSHRFATYPSGQLILFNVSFLSVCQSARDHGAIAGYCLTSDRDLPGQASGLHKKIAKRDAVTLIQCFGNALNLNIHFHMLFLVACTSIAPTGPGLTGSRHAPAGTHSTRICSPNVSTVFGTVRSVGRDVENGYLTGDTVDEVTMTQLLDLVKGLFINFVLPARADFV